ncbi:hypothetical protein M758_4G100600 [Ceratodon purpureus]|uniref:Uncharacterized protein n=1 Tax=Ceratodon purpureus TaxID=3225 RepID=A0A8T0IAF0_CERPU|nr:hypothetical protein KC19_4G101400 [Ceratodon purpureus]KAG0618906.1 hypothetical protein M758_4G100600 [Ceratodon purpureus]
MRASFQSIFTAPPPAFILLSPAKIQLVGFRPPNCPGSGCARVHLLRARGSTSRHTAEVPIDARSRDWLYRDRSRPHASDCELACRLHRPGERVSDSSESIPVPAGHSVPSLATNTKPGV